MTVNDNELLSALVDGELQGGDLDRAIALLATDNEARQRFQHYQFASDAAKGKALTQTIDISQQVSAAIANEPAHSIMTEKPSVKAALLVFPERFWKQAAGLAVAASFGALAVFGTMTQPGFGLAPTAAIPMAAVEDSQTQIAQTSNRWTVTEQEIEDRLNVYLVDHNEYAGASDIFSNARVIAYESGE